MEQKIERKIITKKQFKFYVWALISSGLALQVGLYIFSLYTKTDVSILMFIAGCLNGAGLALANSRTFKIEGFD